MHSPVPVIYILSSGRSGSTLTDLLLGSHPEIWTLGEANLLTSELRKEGMLCGCGAPIQECAFWNEVVADLSIGEGEYPIGHFRESHTRRKTLRWRESLSLLTGGITAGQAEAARRYGLRNAKYFTTVQERAVAEHQDRVEWLVDASKDPFRLYWLLYSGYFNIRAVHLIKDPRAYVYSIARRQKSYSTRDVVRWASRWTIDNLIQSALIQWHLQKEKSLHLRYEDVARRPGKILNGCAEWLRLSEIAGGESMIREYTNHAVSGNEMRWEDTEVRLDERWKYQLEDQYKRIVWSIAGWLATQYGYRFRTVDNSDD